MNCMAVWEVGTLWRCVMCNEGCVKAMEGEK